MPFSKLGLSAEILRAISDQGYSEPTPVQEQAIPPILTGLDVMARAQTGTGKTAGFTWPILQRLKIHSNTSTSPARHPIRALILAPTRELAMQVAESVRTYGRYLMLKPAVVFGGVNINPQIKELQSGVDILVATPGRLLDHVQQRTVNLSRVEILVLDEADRMLDMGFLPDIRRILALLPTNRQNLLFSATFSEDIKKLADSLMKKPARIEIGRSNAAAEMVQHVVHLVDQKRKRELLSHIIKSQNLQQVLVFTRTKHSANRLAQQLVRDGIHSTAIHSNKSQPARIQALADFKSGKVRVLVATDIAARGLDIEELPHVVNYELPHVAGDYVHRIGRAGRAGSSGSAISLVSPEETDQLKDVERFLKFTLPVKAVPGFGPNQRADHHDRGRPGMEKPHAFKREHSNVVHIAPAGKPRVVQQTLAQRQPHPKKSVPALFLPPGKAKHSA
ncbi:MAG TPA: DEAD/DEAH box helicase [Burkholderiales bacterium]|nr:DEAD/DEAH box helicase [Burkholderiales bacterium]